MTSIALCKVKYVPKVLDPNVLYVSEEFKTAAHLCLCGCSTKVVTPLGPPKWTFTEDAGRPSLWPSIGNWQLPCKSHYVIKRGEVLWAGEWTKEEIEAGRRRERAALETYYRGRERKIGFWSSLWKAVLRIFGQ
jgi:hypothetical protein